jgi:hypothetical protein
MVAERGAGPRPIPHRELNRENLAEAIKYCLMPQAIAAAAAIAAKMRSEVGVQAAARSFHSHLPLGQMQCDLLSDQPAVWTYGKAKTSFKFSKAAAEIVLSAKSADTKHLKL